MDVARHFGWWGPPPELNDQGLKSALGQLERERNETYFKMFFTTPGIMNWTCQTFWVVGYPSQTLPKGHAHWLT